MTDSTTPGALAARIDALVLAGRALQKGEPEARETIRKIALSLQDSRPELARRLEGCPHDVPGTLEIIGELASRPTLPKIRVLIIDDDPVVSSALERNLEGPNREVHVAATAAAAEAIVEETALSLILVDLVLPDADGRQLIVRLRERPQTALVPILVISATAATSTQSECYALGADGYFEKPPDLQAVSAAVAGIIQRTATIHGDVRSDPLTGLPNRAAFREIFLRTQSLQSITRQKAALAFLDLDHFKGVNDMYGHAMGDEVLHRIGTSLLQRLRKSDIVARWGGDEFTILLPSADEAGAVRAVESALIGVRGESFTEKNGRSLSIAFSAGVTEVAPQESLEECVSRADGLMYQAKREGGNRVVSAEERPAVAERSILVAEDDEVTAALLKHRLGSEGHRVLHVTAGSAALAVAAEQPLAMAILDVQMPEMDGFQVLQGLRRSPSTQGLPVIMLTGLGNERHIVHGFELGADDYVVKPFSSVELLARVRRLLARG